jgi:hypothetical protein
MGIFVRLTKLTDDGTRATYAFTPGDGTERTLVVDRAEERIWPEDDARDTTFRAAARTVAAALARGGELPDRLLHQS